MNDNDRWNMMEHEEKNMPFEILGLKFLRVLDVFECRVEGNRLEVHGGRDLWTINENQVLGGNNYCAEKGSFGVQLRQMLGLFCGRFGGSSWLDQCQHGGLSVVAWNARSHPTPKMKIVKVEFRQQGQWQADFQTGYCIYVSNIMPYIHMYIYIYRVPLCSLSTTFFCSDNFAR